MSNRLFYLVNEHGHPWNKRQRLFLNPALIPSIGPNHQATKYAYAFRWVAIQDALWYRGRFNVFTVKILDKEALSGITYKTYYEKHLSGSLWTYRSVMVPVYTPDLLAYTGWSFKEITE